MNIRHTTTATLAVTALLGGGALAGCGTSPEDTAHSDGKAVGKAMAQLSNATNAQELTSGVTAVRNAVSDVSDDVSSRVRGQVDAQRDSLNSVVGNLRTAITSDNATAQSNARVELQSDIQDLRSRAQSFSKTNDSVTNSFWDGVKDGFDDAQ
ncbi:MAG TPA: hypothetical protein VFG42_26015 [Baekduia sp.]|uniref:hypothetical protein n=1 Tax=Baekduia sp. TaxID=2600305 RepID=UPI002D78FC76|nr:hypothetical protein [Baekduia sp.]HET6510276.1 hypothetical protein [Baekduia sp.]